MDHQTQVILGKIAFWVVGLPVLAGATALVKAKWKNWRHPPTPVPPPRTTWMLTGEPYDDGLDL